MGFLRRKGSSKLWSPRLRRQRPTARTRPRWLRLEPLEDRRLLAVWSGEIPDGTVWTNSEVQQITGDIHIAAGAKLTIQPGTVVKFNFNAIDVFVDGTLDARGTAAQPIIFTSYRDDTAGGDTNNNGPTTGGNGDWGTIQFNAGSTNNVLDRVEVRWGGGWSSPGLITAKTSSLSVTNSVLRGSSTVGVRIEGSNPTFTNNSWNDNSVAAIGLDLASNPAISGVTMVNNSVNGAVVDGGSFPINNAWDDPDIVYFLNSDTTVPAGKTLTIGAGQIVKSRFSDINLFVDGSLRANGTAAKPVIFTSYRDDTVGGDTNNNGATTGGNGDWGTIQFNPTSTNNLLDYTEVKFAGGWGAPGAVTVINAPLSMNNGVLRNSSTAGIRIEGAAPVLTNTLWQDSSVAVSMDVGASPAITGVTILNNGVNGAVIDGGTLPANNAWDDPDIVYFVNADVTVPDGKTLTVGAGQIVKFRFSDVNLFVNGSLRATGTAAKPVIFTSYRDDTAGGDTNNNGATTGGNGDWGTIQFSATSTNNLLDFTEVRFGGGWGATGAVTVVGAPLTISNSALRYSSSAGVRIEGAAPTLTNNTYQNNSMAAITMDVAASPAITGVVMNSNGINGAVIDGGTLSADNTWNDTDMVYWLSSDVIVPAGKTLTVGAGQIVKFRFADTNLIVNGSFRSMGTVDKPVIFTSYRDDTAGGDTNNNGATNGGVGDWGTIQLNASSTNNSMDFTDVRFGGGWGAVALVTVSGTSLVASNSTFRNSTSSGLRLEGATAALTNNTWRDNVGYMISMDTLSDIAVSGVTMSNNGSNSARIDGGTIPSDRNWDDPDIVYLIGGNINVAAGKKLSVGAGQVIKFASGNNSLFVNGTLQTNGLISKPVVFTVDRDDSVGGDTNNNGATTGGNGDWGMIQFNPNSTNNLLHRTEVRFGGGWGAPAAVSDIGRSLTIRESVIRNSGTNGVLATSGAALSITNSVLVNNSLAGIRGETGAQVDATNNTIHNNQRGVFADGSTTSILLVNNLITFQSRAGVYSANRGLIRPFNNDVFGTGFGEGSYFGMPDATGANGNISADPKYVDQAAGNLRLQSSSPAIDAGTSNGAPSSDLDFNWRVDTLAVTNTGSGDSPFFDLGAFEFGGLPRSVAHDPSGDVAGPISDVVFTFRNAMNTTSFSIASDVVSFTGPNGAITPYAFQWLNAYQLKVQFASQQRVGTYAMTLGSAILDTNGNALDVDGDGVRSENPDDRYVATWTIVPPKIITQTPSDYVSGPIDRMTFTFDRPMNPTSFTLADDLLEFQGPHGNLTAAGSRWVDPTTLEISFAPQTVLGNYQIKLSSQIADMGGNLLDQDGDKIGGEGIADQYEASFTLANILFVSGAIATDTTWSGLVIVQGDVTVNAGIKLTINPGTIVKFSDLTGITVVNGGSLLSNGTVAQPVRITSIHDDTVGGDSDQNGDSLGPQPGDWRGLQFDSANAKLESTIVSYGGGSASGSWNQSGMLRTTGTSTLDVSRSELRDAFFDAVLVQGGPTTISNSIISGADRGVVSWLSGANVQVLNSTIVDNRIGLLGHGGALNVVNSIVAHNLQFGLDNDIDPDPTARYSDFFNPNGTNTRGFANPVGSSGNLSVDPKFRDVQNQNYRLAYASPMIDAADSTVATATDNAGAPRYDDPRTGNTGIPSGGTFADMGAYEFVEGAPSKIDLTPTAVSAPTAGIAGDRMTFQWTVKNVGQEIARGSWNDQVYLSIDNVWTADDVLVATAPHVGDLGVNQSYSANVEAVLPGVATGHYYVLVRSNADNSVFEGQNLGNNTGASQAMAVDVRELQIGVPVSGQWAAAGDVRIYKVNVPPGSDISIRLTGTVSTNELFGRFGNVPSLQEFDQRSIRPNQSNQSFTVGGGREGAFYVMVRGGALAEAASFTLTATLAEFSIANVEPARGSNTGSVTVTLQGAKFTPDSRVHLIDSAGSSIEAVTTYFVNSGELSATFDLRGRAVGMADLRVVHADNTATQLNDSFQVIAGAAGQLLAQVVAPGRVRQGREFSLIVEYANVGDADLLAPIMRLQNTGTSPLSLTKDLSANEKFVDLVGVSTTGPAGILPPGGRGRIEIFSRAVLPSSASDNFKLTSGEYPATPINWGAMESTIRPSGLADSFWNALFTNLKENIGSNWSDYHNAISAAATQLPLSQGMNYSLRDVLQVEFDKAYAELTQTVSGKLFLRDANHPLGGVKITLRDIATGNQLMTTSNTDGQFVINAAVAGSYEVTYEGYLAASSEPLVIGSDDVKDVTLLVTPAGTIAGSVLLAPGGVPQAGIQVTATSQEGNSFTLTTKADGRFSFDSLPPGTYQVRALPGTLTRAIVSDIKIESGTVLPNVNLIVQNGATIRGTVTGPNGSVAGALVVAIDADGNGISGTTAANGQYTIIGLGGGSHRVYATATGLAPAELGTVNVPQGGETTGVNLTLGPAGTISGTVTLAVGGSPAERVLVTAASGGRTYSALSAANGSYSIAGLPPGSYSITTSSDLFMPASANTNVTANLVTTLALQVAPAGIVTGTVTNSTNGSPLARVVVHATGPNGIVGQSVTDSAGKYTIGGLAAGTYRIELSDSAVPGVARTDVTLTAATPISTANFSVAVAGIISGTVFAADGTTPLAEVMVGLVEGSDRIHSMYTDSVGHYSFIVLAAGTYRVEASGESLAFPVIAGLNVSGGASLTNRNLVAGNNTLSGVVRDAVTGQPLENANVRISRTDGIESVSAIASVTTMADGSYQITGAVPGSYRVTAVVSGYAIGSQAVTVTAGVAAVANVGLTGEATIQGTVTDVLDGQPVSRANVLITDENSPNVSLATTTNAIGSFKIGLLPAGTYSLVVSADGRETKVIRGITISANGNVTQNAVLGAPTIQLSGSVSNPAGPMAGVFVVATDSNNLPVASATTAADGSYTLTTIPAGTVSISVSAAGHRVVAPTSRTVAVGNVVTGVNFALAVAALIDPPADVPAGESGNVRTTKSQLFDVPVMAADHPDGSFICAGGSIIIDIGGRYWADKAFKEWQDFYQSAQLIRDNYDGIFKKAEADITKLENVFKKLQSLTKSVESSLSTAINLLEGGAALLGLSAEAKETVADLKKAQEQFGKVGPFMQSNLTRLQSMHQTLQTIQGSQEQDVLRDSLIGVTNLAKTANLFEAVLNALAIGSVMAILDPKVSAKLSHIQKQFDALQDAMFEAAEAASELASTTQIVQLAYYTSFHLQNLKADYESAVISVNNNRKMDPRCGCSYPTVPNPPPGGEDPAARTCDSAPTPTQTIGAPLAPPPSQNPPPTAPPVVTEQDQAQTEKPTSFDPNDKTGPAGFGAQNFIQTSTMPFLIQFENDPNLGATIPAQEVFVTDTLDDDFDLSTLEFTSFGFDNRTFDVPPGLSFYEVTIDLRPDGIDLLVPVRLEVDPVTRILKATFRSLDPKTLDLPDDVDAGFLPVNDKNLHNGEGFFAYAIRPKQGLPTGTQFNNQALIVFDTNAPIFTPTTLHTLDVGSPTSSVTALGAASNTTFLVSWNGTDDANGSGIASYDVYVSDNGGAFTLWKDDITQSSASYVGVAGHQYRFYSIATDHVGHQEAAKTAAEATTITADKPWQNPVNGLDVDDDTFVVPLDALRLINQLNNPTVINPQTGKLPDVRPAGDTPYYDVDGDGFLAPIDVLLVINYLNRLDAEGETSADSTNRLSVETSPLAGTLTNAALNDCSSKPNAAHHAAVAEIFRDEGDLFSQTYDDLFKASKPGRSKLRTSR